MRVFEQQLQENVPLLDLCTLGIGGAARFYVKATDFQTIEAAVKWSKKKMLPLFVLGGGSNILVSDNGFSGLVLHLATKGIEWKQQTNSLLAKVDAGEQWDNFVEQTISKNLAGVECLSGIPGSVGATPIQNVGAYGQEVSETITSVTAYDRLAEKLVTFSNDECHFAYRNSLFKSLSPNRFILLEVTYRLNPDGSPTIRYPELLKLFSQKPSLSELREVVIKLRRSKGMVIDSTDPDSRSAGSFFINPTISKEEFEQLLNRLDLSRELIPNFAAPEGRVKLSAGWLIENAGFQKGYKHSNVAISSKHALALVNSGNAKARDLVELMEQIQSKVKESFDIVLTPEPVFVGF
ncbi:MAG: UDP-N-acetylmuramate dehydrogenase [Blastocatellia bacterium]|nr:UDP-N-acetylmuramate dehydrogenase [Blastocatellia bacterium]